jgi:hypothetical protein
VPAQLHVPHEPVLPRYGVVMLVSAGIIQAKACPTDCMSDGA